MEEEFYFNDFKGAVSITNIVEEHNGFRSQLDEMSKYLESCLPPSTKWGPYSTLVPPTTPNATFDANELVRLIDKLTEVFIQHVRLSPESNCLNIISNLVALDLTDLRTFTALLNQCNQVLRRDRLPRSFQTSPAPLT